MITVVSGALIREGRVLLTQRQPKKAFEYQWESPGGKVVAGKESAHEALVREFKEEVRLDVIRAVLLQRMEFPEYEFAFWFYRVACNGSPVAFEGQGLGWFTYQEVQRLTLTPGNQAALPVLLQEMTK